MGKFSSAYKNMIMFFAVAFLTESDSVIYVKAQIDIFCKRFNMMRVQVLSTLSTFLTSIRIPFKNLGSPISKFFSASRYFVLMGTINRVICNSCFCYFSTMIRGLLSFCGARYTTKVSFAALYFKFKHWLSTARTWCCYCKTVITNSFPICFFITLKTITTNEARFTYTPEWSSFFRCAWPTHLTCRLSKFTDVWGLFSANDTWCEISLITGWTYSIITSVFFTEFTSIFHKSNLPEVAYEVK